MKAKILGIIAIGSLTLVGCSNSSGNYYWGNSHKIGYDYVEQSINENEYIEGMLEVEKDAAEAKRLTPPGFNAEIATMYLKQGNKEKASEYYTKEGQAFPESSYLMTAIVENLDRNNSKDQEESKVENKQNGKK